MREMPSLGKHRVPSMRKHIRHAPADRRGPQKIFGPGDNEGLHPDASPIRWTDTQLTPCTRVLMV